MTMNITCGECGVAFCLPDGLYHARKADGRTFYCPNGHGRCYRPTADQERIAELEKKIDHLNGWIETLLDRNAESLAQREDLIVALRECPGRCGWRSRRQVPRDPEAMARGIERVRADVINHLMIEHGDTPPQQRLLEART